MEDLRTAVFGEEEKPQEDLKRAYHRPSYKGISESLKDLVAEKDRVIQVLEKENKALKKALNAFIGGYYED